MMQLSTSVYSADRGYAWSNTPPAVSEQQLNDFCREISQLRGDFPDPIRVEIGLVSDGRTAAAFTLQNVAKWDSAGRASDYFAFAFFPVSQAHQIDFVDLINNDFFWSPSHTPQSEITYSGGESQNYPPAVGQQLVLRQRAYLENPRALCAVIGDHGAKSGHWLCRLYEGNVLEIKCNPWNVQKEQVR